MVDFIMNFGRFYYEVAVLLRSALLVSSLLFNYEPWYNVTAADLNLLENVDLMLLRRIKVFRIIFFFPGLHIFQEPATF